MLIMKHWKVYCIFYANTTILSQLITFYAKEWKFRDFSDYNKICEEDKIQ